jgi:hypothetical protein
MGVVVAVAVAGILKLPLVTKNLLRNGGRKMVSYAIGIVENSTHPIAKGTTPNSAPTQTCKPGT